MSKIDILNIIENLSGKFKVLFYEEKEKKIYVFVENKENLYSIFKIIKKDKQAIPVIINKTLKESINTFNNLI